MDKRLSELIAPAFFGTHKSIKRNEFSSYLLKGGRGSTKSSFISIEIILGIMRNRGTHALALRKIADTLNDSVYARLQWAINMLGVVDSWKIKSSPMEFIYKPTGQKILFRGLDKSEKLKSITVETGYIRYLWFEEADQYAGEDEIRSVTQSTVRAGDEFTTFYSYNPPKSNQSWVNSWAKEKIPGRFVHHSTYMDVPQQWLGQQFLLDAESVKTRKPKEYDHEYLGKVIGTGGSVFDNIIERPITRSEREAFANIYRGLDFGFTVNPSSYVVMDYERSLERLYIFHEVYERGLSNTALAEAILEENPLKRLVTGDSEDPRTIAELNGMGCNIQGAIKGPDSVRAGMKWLQDRKEIIIDSTTCPETAKEFREYEYARDRYGNFRADFPNENNHSISAVRYGCESISRIKPPVIDISKMTAGHYIDYGKWRR